MAILEIAPKPGEIWKEVDPRVTRFVKILTVGTAEALIRKCLPNGDIPKRSPSRQAKLSRFNGARGGYERFSDTSGEQA